MTAKEGEILPFYLYTIRHLNANKNLAKIWH